jgi:pimeloyl-ACP methyl ester carboxylesterase
MHGTELVPEALELVSPYKMPIATEYGQAFSDEVFEFQDRPTLVEIRLIDGQDNVLARVSFDIAYLNGRLHRAESIPPESYTLDMALLERSGNKEIQLDLFLDYASNLRLYPKFQEYFRRSKPPLLAIWGKNDPFFIPAGAEAFRKDIPGAKIQFLDTGHFALETHVAEVASAIRDFLETSGIKGQSGRDFFGSATRFVPRKPSPRQTTGRVTVRAFRPDVRHAYQRLTPVEIPSLPADQDR